jgi:hypothetical protein
MTERKTQMNGLMKMILAICLLVVVLCPLLASAQLAVTVSPPKIAGQKAVIELLMKNGFNEKVESARAAVFLLDDQGKIVGQSTKWVIGGNTNNPGLAAGGTNAYYFVIQSTKPFTTTNLISKVTFSRVLLQSGKFVDVKQNVQIRE